MASVGDRWTNPDSLTTPGHDFRCECELCQELRLDGWRGEARRLQEVVKSLSEEVRAYASRKPGATGRDLRRLLQDGLGEHPIYNPPRPPGDIPQGGVLR